MKRQFLMPIARVGNKRLKAEIDKHNSPESEAGINGNSYSIVIDAANKGHFVFVGEGKIRVTLTTGEMRAIDAAKVLAYTEEKSENRNPLYDRIWGLNGS